MRPRAQTSSSLLPMDKALCAAQGDREPSCQLPLNAKRRTKGRQRTAPLAALRTGPVSIRPPLTSLQYRVRPPAAGKGRFQCDRWPSFDVLRRAAPPTRTCPASLAPTRTENTHAVAAQTAPTPQAHKWRPTRRPPAPLTPTLARRSHVRPFRNASAVRCPRRAHPCGEASSAEAQPARAAALGHRGEASTLTTGRTRAPSR